MKINYFQKGGGAEEIAKAYQQSLILNNAADKLNGAGFKTEPVGPGMGKLLAVTKAAAQPTLTYSNPLFKSALNEAWWLKQANDATGGLFKTIDDIIAWQKANGLVADGKFGKNSITKWNALNPKPVPEAPAEDKSLDLMIQAGEKLAANKLLRQTSNLFSGILSGVTTQNQYPAMLQWQRANDQIAMQLDMATNPQNYFGTDQTSANALKMQSLNNIEKTLPIALKSAPQTTVALSKSNNMWQKWQNMAKAPMTHGWYKEGGRIKFQAGGQIQQDPVGQVIQGLLQDPQGTMQALSQMQGQQGGKEQVNAILQEIVKRAKAGDQQAAQAIQVLQQAMQGGQQAAPQQAPMAKNGAKLNYFRKLKGLCPEGEEMVYLKKGGCMCQKKKDGGEAKAPKKQFFGKNKQVKKEEDGGKAKNNSITATQRRSKFGNEVGTEKHDNGLTRSFMQGPGLSNPYFMQINRGDTTVTTTGPQLGAQYQTTPSQRQEAINFFNAQDTLPLLYKQRVSADAAMYKNGGKAQFFKKEKKAPIAKCGCKAKKKK